jgi:hypothetical protein
MRRRGTGQRHWVVIGALGTCAVLATIWEHSYEASLAREQSRLIEAVQRADLEVNFERVRVAEATANTEAQGAAAARLGLMQPGLEQVVLLSVPAGVTPPTSAGGVASLRQRVSDALLPAARARDTQPDER